MRKNVLVLLMAFVGLAWAQGWKVTDATGRTVTISDLSRIVVLQHVATELVYALGLGDRVVGRDITSIYPNQVRNLPTLGHPRRLSAEGILALRPTLILGGVDMGPPQVVEQLLSTGIPLVRIKEDATLEAARERIRMVAQAVNKKERGEELLRRLERDLLALKSHLAQNPPKKRLRALFVVVRGQNNVVCGDGSVYVEKLKLAGLENAARGIQECKEMTPESVLMARPDILVTTTAFFDAAGLEGLLRLPGVAQTPAAAKGRILVVHDNYLSAFGIWTGRSALDIHRAAYLQEGLVRIEPPPLP